MRVISRKSKAKEAAYLWKSQYYTRSGWPSDGKESIYNALVSLGDNPDPDTVNKIIGNSSWTECYCDQCQKVANSVIEVGDEPNYDSATAHLCFPCVSEAYKFMFLENAKCQM